MAIRYLFLVLLTIAICSAQAVTEERCKREGGDFSQVYGNAIYTSDGWSVLSNNRNVTLASVCIKYHDDCLNEGAGCPLYITLNTGYAWFNRVNENNKIIVLEGQWDWTTDNVFGVGSPIKNAFAAIPRAVAENFPGLDRTKVYVVGWQQAAAGIAFGLMGTGRGVDRSPYGATSSIYAAVAAVGGCVAADAVTWGRDQTTTPLCGHFHVFNTIGQNDTVYTRDECLTSMQVMAVTNGCSRPNSDWCSVLDNDPYVPRTEINGRVRYIDFGSCRGGDVRGYSFNDQGRVTTYTVVSPHLNAFDMVWTWLQGRTKPLGEGQLGPHPGNSVFCNSTRTPAVSWTYQREPCNLDAAFAFPEAKFKVTMPGTGVRNSPASVLSVGALGFVTLAALILA